MSSGPKDHDKPRSDAAPDTGANHPENVSPVDDDSEKLVLSAPDSATSLRDISLWAGIFFLIALTVYSPALRGDFLWDDDRHVSQNVALRTSEGFAQLWVPGTTPQYYPVTHSAFWLLYQVAHRSDGTINTLIFHLANVLLHAGSATLLWFILRRLKIPGAWLAAAIFAVHPVQVESVAWISELKNVLSGVFLFGSIMLYLRFAGIGEAVLPTTSKTGRSEKRDAPAWDLYGLSLLLFVCALLSKSVTCAMPAVILLLIWWKRGRVIGRDLLRLAPFFLLGIAMAIVTIRMEHGHVIGTQIESGDWSVSAVQRVLIAGHAVWFYFTKIILPMGLTFIYPKWNVEPGNALLWLYPAGVVAVLVVLWSLRSKIGRGPLVATLIYVGMLVPALGFINVYPMRYSYVADHFQYHAAAAMIALIVAGLATLSTRLFPEPAEAPESPGASPPAEDIGPSPAPYILGAVLVLLLSLVAWRHAQAFDNAISLWEDTTAKNPKAWMAYNNLSAEYFALAAAQERSGDAKAVQDSLKSAILAADRAIEVKPDHDGAYVNRGLALEMVGRLEDALRDYNRAGELNPENADAQFYKGNALDQLGKYNEAVAAYDAAIAIDTPAALRERKRFLRAKGNTLMSLNRDNDAEAAFLGAMELDKDYLDAHYDYGVLLARQSKINEALQQFLYVLRRNPRHLDSKVSLAYLQMEVGNIKGAQRQLVEAGLIDPYNTRLQEAAKKWAELAALADATTRAATQSATTRSTTTPSTTRSATQPTVVPATTPTAVPASAPAPATIAPTPAP